MYNFNYGIMNKNNFRFPAIIIAVILGIILFKHFNFNTMTFKEPWLDILYVATFIGILFFLFRSKSDNNVN
jgi:uncharacterized membrane protein